MGIETAVESGKKSTSMSLEWTVRGRTMLQSPDERTRKIITTLKIPDYTDLGCPLEAALCEADL
jgi:hypothetical protein